MKPYDWSTHSIALSRHTPQPLRSHLVAAQQSLLAHVSFVAAQQSLLAHVSSGSRLCKNALLDLILAI
jgi:hypothetical protein